MTDRIIIVTGALGRFHPDIDILGGLICLIGVGVIMYWPRE